MIDIVGGLRGLVDPIVPPAYAHEAADEIERLRNENAELIGRLDSVKADLWWLVGGGEFSHWFENSGVELPWAALKEWEEARRHFPELVAEDAQSGSGG